MMIIACVLSNVKSCLTLYVVRKESNDIFSSTIICCIDEIKIEQCTFCRKQGISLDLYQHNKNVRIKTPLKVHIIIENDLEMRTYKRKES